jgi:seryl-tRNA synthetase
MMRQETLEEPDVLEEMIVERTMRNQDFPKLMEAAARRRTLLRELAYLLSSRVVSKLVTHGG